MIKVNHSQKDILEWLPDVETAKGVGESPESLVQDVVEKPISSVGF